MKRTRLILAAILILGCFRAGQAAIEDWSPTASLNNSASPDGAPEGMAPSAVNNVMREMMAQVRRFAAQATSGAFGPDTGSQDTYVVNPQISWAGYVSGQVIRWLPNSTNTVTDVSLNVSGLGKISVVTISGATVSSLVTGAIVEDQVAEAVYDGSRFLLRPTYSDPMGSRGDILYRNSSNQTARLPIGDANTVLRSDGTDISWSASNVGTQTIWLPASALIARTTSGASIGTTESTTNKVMLKTMDFDADTQEHAQFHIAMPKSWNAGTFTAQFVWTAISGSGVVDWGIQCLAQSDGDTIDTAFGTAQVITDTLITIDETHVSGATPATTCSNTPAQNDNVWFQVYRAAAEVADTFTVDASLIGVKLLYTIDAGNDD